MRLARGTHKRTKLKVNLWSTASSYYGNSASPTTTTTPTEKRNPSRYSIYVNCAMRRKTILIFIALPANTKCVLVDRVYDERQVPILCARIRISTVAGLRYEVQLYAVHAALRGDNTGKSYYALLSLDMRNLL